MLHKALGWQTCTITNDAAVTLGPGSSTDTGANRCTWYITYMGPNPTTLDQMIKFSKEDTGQQLVAGDPGLTAAMPMTDTEDVTITPKSYNTTMKISNLLGGAIQVNWWKLYPRKAYPAGTAKSVLGLNPGVCNILTGGIDMKDHADYDEDSGAYDVNASPFWFKDVVSNFKIGRGGMKILDSSQKNQPLVFRQSWWRKKDWNSRTFTNNYGDTIASSYDFDPRWGPLMMIRVQGIPVTGVSSTNTNLYLSEKAITGYSHYMANLVKHETIRFVRKPGYLQTTKYIKRFHTIAAGLGANLDTTDTNSSTAMVAGAEYSVRPNDPKAVYT